MKWTAIALGLAPAVLAALPARADPPIVPVNMLCGARDMVVAELTDRYGEVVLGMGLAQQNRIMEFYVSEETGSWTITVTTAEGITCLMASGQHFAALEPEPAGEDL